MATNMTFTDGVTVIPADWLNFVNGVVNAATVPTPAPTPPPPTPSPTPAPTPSPVPLPPAIATQGVNLSGMENSTPRWGTSTVINLNWTTPRQTELAWLVSQGLTRHRLPIRWELVQPVLLGSPANAAVLAAHGISAAGKLSPRHMSYILDVLDAAAAAGAKILVDLHNYCRYSDFLYQGDGSIIGFNAGTALAAPYTSSGAQIYERIFSKSLADPVNTISEAQFVSFWTEFVNYVEVGTLRAIKGHAGLAGYGLMNEPHDMPTTGGTIGFTYPEDLTIWTAFAQAAITAIRALDAATAIYVAGNLYEVAWSANPGGAYLSNNPPFPLVGSNLIYSTHHYLDHISSGGVFDWTIEAAAAFSAGETNAGGITTGTGAARANYTKNAVLAGLRMALTEIGMPINNVNWQTSFEGAMVVHQANNVEAYLWTGGNHWSYNEYPVNGIPNWKDGRTFEPQAFGVYHKVAGRTKYSIYAVADKNWGAAATVCTVTLFIRGYTPAAITVNISRTGTGTLSAASRDIPAGVNTSVTFTYTTAGTEKAVVTFAGPTQVPPPMPFYSMDPFTYVGTDPVIAGEAAIAKYAGLEYLAVNAFNDYTGGAACGPNDDVRALHNSGYSETFYNTHGMKNWINPAYDTSIVMPKFNRTGATPAIPYIQFAGCRGLWSMKRYANQNGANTENTCVTLAPFNRNDDHFMVTCFSVPNQVSHGAIFAAVHEMGYQRTELRMEAGKGQVLFSDAAGVTASLTTAALLTITTPHVLTVRSSAAGVQNFRLDKVAAGSLASVFPAEKFTSLQIGFTYHGYYPWPGFTGDFFGAICGKGLPTDDELGVMEEYLALKAGSTLVPPAPEVPETVADLTGWMDPSYLPSLLQSSVWGGSVTGAGQLVGQVNPRTGTVVTFSLPDTDRHVLEKPGSYWYLDNGQDWLTSGNGGGSTTAFFFIHAFKLQAGWVSTMYSEQSFASGGQGYEVIYDGNIDKIVFRCYVDAFGWVPIVCDDVINFTTGGPWVIMCWDDGTNLKVQLNNGTIYTSAAHGAIKAGFNNPTIYAKYSDGTDPMYAANYGMMWAKNSQLTAGEKAALKTWLGAKAGLTL